MAIRTIPIDPALLAFSFKVDLDNKSYRFRFAWNARVSVWTMNVLSEAGIELVNGIPIYPKQLLLKPFQYNEDLPQGNLFALNLVDGNTPPTRENFGSDVVVLYEEAE